MRLVKTDSLVDYVTQNCKQRAMQTRAITEIIATTETTAAMKAMTTRATTMRGASTHSTV